MAACGEPSLWQPSLSSAHSPVPVTAPDAQASLLVLKCRALALPVLFRTIDLSSPAGPFLPGGSCSDRKHPPGASALRCGQGRRMLPAAESACWLSASAGSRALRGPTLRRGVAHTLPALGEGQVMGGEFHRLLMPLHRGSPFVSQWWLGGSLLLKHLEKHLLVTWSPRQH